MRRLLRTGCLLLGMLPLCGAMPFVAAPGEPLARQLATCKAAVVITPTAHPDLWTVREILKDSTASVRVGQVIRPAPALPAAERSLLISGGDGLVIGLPCTAAASEYLALLPPETAPPAERLRFASAACEAADPLVSADAFAVLANCSAEEVSANSSLISRERLRTALGDPQPPVDRTGLYGFILGLAGDPNDATLLRRLIFHQRTPLAQGLDGIAAGYVLLTGETGLTDLETNLFLKPKISPLEVAAVLHGLEELRHLGLGPPRDRLRTCICTCLLREDTADLAIGSLHNAREWPAARQVAGVLFSADGRRDLDRAVQVSAVRFLSVCRTAPDAAVADRRIAHETLSRIAATDADLLRRAALLSGE